jgi:hypothetical protein
MLKKFKIEHLFIVCMFVLFAGFIAASQKDFVAQREMMGVLGPEENKLSFYDFQMDTIIQESIYNDFYPQRVYPPLVYVVYWELVKENASQFFYKDKTDYSLTKDGVFVVVFSLIIFSFVFFFQLYSLKTGNNCIKFLSTLALMFSGIYLYALYAGNLVVLITAFLIFFLVNYKNRSVFIREMSVLSLALAVAVKPYLAFMAILLLFDREYKLLIRAAIYSFLLVFVPFFFVDLPPGVYANGIMDKFLKNISKWLDFLFVYKTNIVLSFPENIGSNVFNHEIRAILYPIIRIFSITFSIVAIMAAPFFREEWKKVCLMVCALFLIASGATVVQYCFIYFFPCVIMFLNSNTKINLSNMIYLIAFVLLLNPLQIGKVSGITITWLLVKIAFWIIFFHLIFDGFRELLKEKGWRKRIWFLSANEKQGEKNQC